MAQDRESDAEGDEMEEKYTERPKTIKKGRVYKGNNIKNGTNLSLVRIKLTKSKYFYNKTCF